MAQIAMGDNYRLYEEALTIYKRKNMHNEAIEVLISKINDLQRAEDYAEKVNEPSVWSKLGETYLNNGNVVNAMDAFMKCKDHTFYLRVIGLMESEEEGEEKDFKYQPFIKYLLMVRDATKDVAIDNALTFAYSKLGKLQ
jgi:clathrin heavy chain